MEGEESLEGGNAAEGVVRLGDTVRKPWLPTTAATNSYVTHLRAAGIDAPRPLGRDEHGRQIIEFVPGRLAQDDQPFGVAALQRVGHLVRRIHDASADYPVPDAQWPVLIPVPDPNLICHNDLAPWNLITGERWVFIDWDGAGPSTRLWDLAYSAQAFANMNPSAPVADAAARLRAFVDGYGADHGIRDALPAAIADRTIAMYELLRASHARGQEPWASMFVTGHGEYWQSVAAYVNKNWAAWIDAVASA